MFAAGLNSLRVRRVRAAFAHAALSFAGFAYYMRAQADAHCAMAFSAVSARVRTHTRAGRIRNRLSQNTYGRKAYPLPVLSTRSSIAVPSNGKYLFGGCTWLPVSSNVLARQPQAAAHACHADAGVPRSRRTPFLPAILGYILFLGQRP